MNLILTAPPLHDLSDPRGRGHIRVCPNLALYLLAAVAEAAGHAVRVIDPIEFEAAFAPETLAATALEADVLGISVNSCTWPRARRLLADLARLPRRPVTVVGGPHASVLGEHVMQAPGVDYAVAGEGERTLVALLAHLDTGRSPADLPGVCAREAGSPGANSPPLLTPEELRDLPLPRLDLMPQGYYDLIPIESSRGCRYACIFCSTIHRRSWRGLDAATFHQRLDRLAPALGRSTQRGFFIIDDCFTADHERLDQISRDLSGFSASFVFEARITDVIAPGVADSLARLPVRVMEMGIECGYTEGLKKVGKRLTLDQVDQAAQLLGQAGLAERGRFSFILGLPWESRAEIFRTLAYGFKLAARGGSRLVASWLTVFPGSTIWRRRQEWGIRIEAEDYDRDSWWSDPELFRRCHPRLNPGQDLDAILAYIQLLMNLFPAVRHDGWFRHITAETSRTRD